MIDDSCEVPREDLDDGFNPCRKQVVENGELESYAHMYDVMNERYDREEDTSYLNSVKRDRINQSTPKQTADGGKLYAQDGQGVEGFVKSSGTLDPTTHAEIPSSKAVADYVSSQIPDISAIEAEIDGKLDKYEDGSGYDKLYAVGPTGTQYMSILASTIPESGYEGNPTTIGAIKDYAPIPLPVSKGGTGAQTRSLKTAAGLTLLPVIDSIGASGALNGYTSVTNIATFITTNNIRPEIAAEFENRIADSVADNNLLPTNALMMDYVDAHSMKTPPGKFSYAVSPFPTGTWEGEMNINVIPVFSVNIGTVEYVIARVYGTKQFNYTGTADNINLFSSLKPVGDYTSIFSGSTNIPLTLSVSGRSYTAGTYGLTPNGSSSNLSLNNQIVSSVFNLGDFNISTNLKCVFGEGTKTPGVSVTVNCVALMWHSVS